DTATITVTEPAVPGVAISPSEPAPIEVGGTQSFEATPTDGDGNELCDSEDAENNGPACDLPVTWTSGSSTIAEVDSSGTVTGRSEGSVRIFA
ncbi:MAG: Ig-like domain-containing protein, partial [Bradymonadaceae bacterium]